MHEAKLQGKRVLIRRKKANTLADLRDGVVGILAVFFFFWIMSPYHVAYLRRGKGFQRDCSDRVTHDRICMMTVFRYLVRLSDNAYTTIPLAITG